MKRTIFPTMAALLVCASAWAQVNSGSNGSDGALDFSSINYTTNIVINMADHPNGIYQYTSVYIPSGVTLTFIPNANNTPVVWLVQNNVVINGQVDVSGQAASDIAPGVGGPGGGWGGNGGSVPTGGQGPGGGPIGVPPYYGVNASYGTSGGINGYGVAPAPVYGNTFLIPLLGGSGGGGADEIAGSGGGGGGAILVASSQNISLNGSIYANGGRGGDVRFWGCIGGGGSGGGIRLVGNQISGTGSICGTGGWGNGGYGGSGRIRLDAIDERFGGTMQGVFTVGSQFIVIQTSGQGAQLMVTSVGGVPVSASPSGQITTPDAVLSAQQNNPIPVVVSCANLPLNTQITVSVRPANGSPVSATSYNTIGTLASSTATIPIVIPRGGGLIYATAATGN